MYNASEEASRERAVQDAVALAPRQIYEIIRRDGEEELERPKASLVWSGFAAGILISISLIAEAILRSSLPDIPARHVVENFGYCFGFLVVILGKMQLFTENTITTVLPVMAKPTRRCITRATSLWIVVLLANVAGALAAAIFFSLPSAIPADFYYAALELSHHAVSHPAGTAFIRAIPAGTLIAAIVWMAPQAESAAFLLVVVFTWLIAAGDFTHIIVGSVEMWMLLIAGEIDYAHAAFRFFLPVLAGNVVGGTAIFTLLAWGQVRHEVAPPVKE